MQTKTYFATSVPAALEVARQELGQDALLVGSRPAPAAARQYGRLEVTFAFDPRQEAPRPVEMASFFQAANPAKSPAPASAIDEIRQELSALRVAVGGAGAQVPAKESMAERQLVERGFSANMASEIASAVSGKPGDPSAAVLQELIRRIPVTPSRELNSGDSRILAFIGPPGRGKTTSLVKIALNLGLAQRVPVRIYTAGAHPVGAQEQMARYATILGIPWQAYESLAGLNLALNGEEWKGLSLIDTPGIAPADRDELDELTGFFAGHAEIEKHLVLRADAGSADMLQMISRFSALKPTHLFFTSLDEAVSSVPMIENLIRCGIPAQFAGTGQSVSEDLALVNADRLARKAWSVATVPARYAAAA